MAEPIPALISKLHRARPVEVDEYVCNRLRGSTDSVAEMRWRGEFVTALRIAKLWPPTERELIR